MGSNKRQRTNYGTPVSTSDIKPSSEVPKGREREDDHHREMVEEPTLIGSDSELADLNLDSITGFKRDEQGDVEILSHKLKNGKAKFVCNLGTHLLKVTCSFEDCRIDCLESLAFYIRKKNVGQHSEAPKSIAMWKWALNYLRNAEKVHWGRGSPIYLGHMVTIFGLL